MSKLTNNAKNKLASVCKLLDDENMRSSIALGMAVRSHQKRHKDYKDIPEDVIRNIGNIRKLVSDIMEVVCYNNKHKTMTTEEAQIYLLKKELEEEDIKRNFMNNYKFT